VSKRKAILSAACAVVLILCLAAWLWSTRIERGTASFVRFEMFGGITNAIFSIPMPKHKTPVPQLTYRSMLGVEWIPVRATSATSKSYGAEYHFLPPEADGQLWLRIVAPVDVEEWSLRISVEQQLKISRPGADWRLPFHRRSIFESRAIKQSEIPPQTQMKENLSE
jgi:hypothetical protein